MKRLFLLFNLLVIVTIGFAQSTSCNCCTDNHQAFDFWEGTWEVSKPDGSEAGTNVIDKIQDGCILRENWTSASAGYTGTSYNFYNAQKNQWEQIWVDNQGGSLHLKGNRVGNQMILESDELKNQQGQLYKNRVTWTLNEDGSVRQLWEYLQGEKVVGVAFDGLYKKKVQE
ncbi:hypothetical protein ACFQ1M_14550 [Sungkyunkwania multivorans]|uniref:Uncharacterized protein n=1 Tax=Sungkyunkwania multivorans TaxID=1173618 RepID=A0ABW3D2W2_9FLAO